MDVVCISVEPELEFSSSSQAMKVPSRSEPSWGTSNVQAETKLDYFCII